MSSTEFQRRIARGRQDAAWVTYADNVTISWANSLILRDGSMDGILHLLRRAQNEHGSAAAS